MYKVMNWRMYHPTNEAGGAPADPPAAEEKTEPESGVSADMVKETSAEAKIEVQKMADAIVAKKLKSMPSKEELAVFRKWQESQKTPEQKESEEIQRLREEAAKNAAKVTVYERKDTVVGSGIAPSYADFVAYEVGKLVTDETDFSTALAGYVKTNPQFKGQLAPQRTQLPHGGSAEQMDDVEKAFYARNPELK